MEHDDEQARRSRVVVETPNARREVTHTEAVRSDRGGISGATVGVIVVVAIALITIVVLFLMNQPTDTTNANLTEQPPAQQPVIVQQPATQQQPPVIIQQPAPAGAAPPIIINQPAPSGDSGSTGSQDGAIQAAIDKKISEDPTLSTLGITATVLDGKVTLTGTVKSEGLKSQIERMIRNISGVRQVDNQIVAMG